MPGCSSGPSSSGPMPGSRTGISGRRPLSMHSPPLLPTLQIRSEKEQIKYNAEIQIQFGHNDNMIAMETKIQTLGGREQKRNSLYGSCPVCRCIQYNYIFYHRRRQHHTARTVLCTIHIVPVHVLPMYGPRNCSSHEGTELCVDLLSYFTQCSGCK